MSILGKRKAFALVPHIANAMDWGGYDEFYDRHGGPRTTGKAHLPKGHMIGTWNYPGLRRATYSRGRRSPRGRFRKAGYYGRYNNGNAGGGGMEQKFHDLDVVATTATAGTIVPSLNLIAQGTGESQRLGRRAIISSINIRYRAVLQATTSLASGNASVRIMVIKDSQCNGAAATALNVLETANYQSFNNLANKGRFTTLYDKSFTLNTLAAAGDGTTNDTAATGRTFSFFKKCRIPILFNSTTGAIGEVCCNNIFMLQIGEVASAVTLDGKIRVRFIG